MRDILEDVSRSKEALKIKNKDFIKSCLIKSLVYDITNIRGESESDRNQKLCFIISEYFDYIKAGGADSEH